MIETKLAVKGMTCGGCVRSVERVLTALPGVTRVEVSLELASATVQHDEARSGKAELARAVQEAGFEAA
ncbi:heavy-metal-associated domain-containing protein [Viridibacterium curvum]|uniref:Heavy-metal-associated domain-containing protein n=1 Tax=Viridibacterium curvum TaxID=1101404 RepID=A0ABP9Q7A9_9RHOO